MARTVTVNGQSYSVPEDDEKGYGASLTAYLVALATSFPQLNNAALQALGAELDLGSAFGIKLPYIKPPTANPATSGLVRLAKTDFLAFRNNANGADLKLELDAADKLKFGGEYLTGNPMLSATTAAGQSINNAATTIVVFGTAERDSDSGYNAGTGRYTVPTGKGGDYFIQGAATFANALTNAGFIAIFKNAAGVKESQYTAPPAGQTQTVSAIVNLAAGDIVDIRVQQNQGGAQALQTAAIINFFTLKRLPG